MPIRTPTDIAADLVKTVASKKAKYAADVLKPRRPFNTAAAAAYPKMEDKLKSFLDSGLWPAIMGAVDYQAALKTASTHGADALVSGVAARETKIANFWMKWQPILNTHTDRIQALPNASDQNREDRVIQNLRGLKALKGTWRGIQAPAPMP